MRWYKCKDVLPEENGKYLVYVKNITGYKRLKHEIFIADYFCGDWLFNGWEDNKVTHWMNLPEKP